MMMYSGNFGASVTAVSGVADQKAFYLVPSDPAEPMFVKGRMIAITPATVARMREEWQPHDIHAREQRFADLLAQRPNLESRINQWHLCERGVVVYGTQQDAVDLQRTVEAFGNITPSARFKEPSRVSRPDALVVPFTRSARGEKPVVAEARYAGRMEVPVQAPGVKSAFAAQAAAQPQTAELVSFSAARDELVGRSRHVPVATQSQTMGMRLAA